MDKLIVAASPHIRSKRTTQNVMLDVIIALAPALVASAVIFGWRALMLTAVSVASCVLFEYISRKIMKKSNTISDLSAVVTGILLAFNLPPAMPVYGAVIGSFVAIVIVKQFFGGLGQNFANPAITARIVLMLSFTSKMTAWSNPVWCTDAVASATPLEMIAKGEEVGIKSLLLGTHAGCLGETCAVALIIGGIYLVVRRVISPVTPIAFIATVGALSFVSGGEPISQILSGGLLLGAIFMATDYATTPLTLWGKLIFGIGCGLITFVIREFASFPEGVSFSILLMNLLTPYIDRLTATRPLGVKKEEKNA